MKHLSVKSQGINLNVVELGDPAARHTLLLLHGLRDNAFALLPMLEPLLHPPSGLRILLLESRGHGGSDVATAYNMSNFILDVHNVKQSLIDSPFALFGHSLGGHIAARYTALFPQEVDALILVEGLGPPRRTHEDDPALALASYRDMLLAQIAPRVPRPLANLDEAVEKLVRNNPRLGLSRAQDLALHLTRVHNDQLVWAFDSRANVVFAGSSTDDNRSYWQQISRPTLIVSGMLAHEYWQREMATEGFSGQFATGEMEARIACFAQGEHHWFDKSGHMVHYDEPNRLGQLCRKFLEKNYE